MEKKHLTVVCAVVCLNGKYLCTQRARKGFSYTAEHWEFPGGKVKEGESDHEALLREIHEEMDWDIYVGKQLATVCYDYPDFTITLRAYDCMARNTDYKLLEHLDAKWLKREQLPQLKWTEADRLLVEKL